MSYRQRLNRMVWAFGGRTLLTTPEWEERRAWRERMVLAEVFEANHGSKSPDLYRDRLATYLPEVRA